MGRGSTSLYIYSIIFVVSLGAPVVLNSMDWEGCDEGSSGNSSSSLKPGDEDEKKAGLIDILMDPYWSEEEKLEKFKRYQEKNPASLYLEVRNGRTAIHIAAGYGYLSIVKYLLSVCDVNVNMPDRGGLAALHHAAFEGQLIVLEELLGNSNVITRAVTKKGSTALHSVINGWFRPGVVDNQVIEEDFLRVIEQLVAADSRLVNYVREETSPLHLAAFFGWHRGVSQLLRLRASPSAFVHDTALHRAVRGLDLYCNQLMRLHSRTVPPEHERDKLSEEEHLFSERAQAGEPRLVAEGYRNVIRLLLQAHPAIVDIQSTRGRQTPRLLAESLKLDDIIRFDELIPTDNHETQTTTSGDDRQEDTSRLATRRARNLRRDNHRNIQHERRRRLRGQSEEERGSASFLTMHPRDEAGGDTHYRKSNRHNDHSEHSPSMRRQPLRPGDTSSLHRNKASTKLTGRAIGDMRRLSSEEEIGFVSFVRMHSGDEEGGADYRQSRLNRARIPLLPPTSPFIMIPSSASGEVLYGSRASESHHSRQTGSGPLPNQLFPFSANRDERIIPVHGYSDSSLRLRYRQNPSPQFHDRNRGYSPPAGGRCSAPKKGSRRRRSRSVNNSGLPPLQQEARRGRGHTPSPVLGRRAHVPYLTFSPRSEKSQSSSPPRGRLSPLAVRGRNTGSFDEGSSTSGYSGSSSPSSPESPRSPLIRDQSSPRIASTSPRQGAYLASPPYSPGRPNRIITRQQSTDNGDVIKRESLQSDALFNAIRHGRESEAITIIENNRDSLVDQYRTEIGPIYWAAEHGRARVLTRLIGINKKWLNQRLKDGMQPIHIAAFRAQLAVVVLMRDVMRVNPVDQDGRTLLHWAARGGHIDLIELLINRYSLPVNVPDNNGNTPLYDAARGRQLPAVQWLIEQTNAENTANVNGLYPIHGAAYGGQKGGQAIVNYFIAKGLHEAHVTDNEGNSLLHFAAQRGNIATIQWLVNTYHMNITLTNKHGATLLHIAALCGHRNLVKWLIKKGLSVTAPAKDGKTPIDFAQKQGHRRLAQWMKRQITEGQSVIVREVSPKSDTFFYQ